MEKKTIFLISTIFLLALALRLYQLDDESLWTDEAFSVHHASEDLPQLLADVSLTEAVPPGYYIFLHFWIKAFGNSGFSVRLPSVIFSLLSLVVLFFLSQKWKKDLYIAVLSILFFATSMLQILYAQEARIYSLFTLLFLSALYFLAEIKDHPSASKFYVGYALSMLLALFTNYLALPLIFGFTLILLWLHFTAWKRWIWSNFLVLLCFLPLLPVLKFQFISLNYGLAQSLINKSMPAFLANMGLFVYTLPLLMLFALTLLILRHKEKMSIFWQRFSQADLLFFYLLLVWASFYIYLSFKPLTLLGISFIRSPLTHSYFLIRHSFFLAPVLYLLVAWRIQKIKIAWLRILSIAIVLITTATALSAYYSLSTKAEWQEVGEFIAHYSDSPLVLLDKGGMSNEFLARYYIKSQVLVKLTWSERKRESSQIDEEQLFKMLQQRPDFWLILAKNPKTGDYYRDLLDAYFHRDLSQEFNEIKVYHYARYIEGFEYQ
ncbi:glycosyltransferase family 39 protein [Candidatus Woesearchaeota archaeon]|nr:glycosyltransferase family 39 protein [Candidatus Woesearchaeota archaeon]